MTLSKLNFVLIPVLLCCFGILNSTYAQSSSLFSYEEYTNTTGDTLKYRQLVSDIAIDTKYPLIIFLHGMGERGNDNEAQLKWGVRNFATSENMSLYPSVVIAPQCPSDTFWGNFNYQNMTLLPEPTKPMQLLKELIDKTIKDLPIDTNRIYVTGLSMGGFGTFDAISRYPDLFAAAVPVCGGGDITKAAAIAHIPMWIFHGAKDGAVGAALSQNMLEALTKAGAYPGFTQYPEAGHFSWIAAYNDKMMMAWLFKQHK
ncbi:prolyl oligopeptidase family serine peptidase [Seonamhaeicola sp.]|uniref:carboxylesterase family protein n=1 Tax=Seonamhaeicola sp. TaxID=1912245 RepID=UPI002618DB00|nr:prolyl oligopeptidase family serine peptidase [Seonamhaeicola sp.]